MDGSQTIIAGSRCGCARVWVSTLQLHDLAAEEVRVHGWPTHSLLQHVGALPLRAIERRSQTLPVAPPNPARPGRGDRADRQLRLHRGI
jgi:hypothetical protein